ncbi:MAG TPA: DUF305 domain-containing protein [Trebonia sp.]
MTNGQRLRSALSAMAIATLALAGPALAQQPAGGTTPATPAMPMHPGMSMPSMSGPAMSSPAGMANVAAMNKMSQTMGASSMTGDPDRDFVGMMVPHHQGAIDMAKVELKYGKDPVLRRMAADVVAAQEREIAEMKAWQAKHPKP